MEHLLHFVALTFEHFEVSHFSHHVAFAANGMLAVSLCYHGVHFVHEVRHKRRTTKALLAQRASLSGPKGNRKSRRNRRAK